MEEYASIRELMRRGGAVLTGVNGVYAFPSLPIGHYSLEVASPSFRDYRKTGIVLDANSALKIDIVLRLGEHSDAVVVAEDQLQVEATNTQNGEVITAAQMTAVPLNGRSFTDLLALQPGVAPVTSITSDTVQDVGASVLSPSGDLNPGTVSINGQREFANSFIVNGSDVEEDVNNGASVIPNLDSIAEFRILANNFDAEYGEFSGGQINVVTKSGTNRLRSAGCRLVAVGFPGFLLSSCDALTNICMDDLGQRDYACR